MTLKLFIAFIFALISFPLFAQFPLPQNLNNVKSADITLEQLNRIDSYVQNNNLNYQQAYDLLITRGMKPVEAQFVRERLEKAPAGKTSDTQHTTDRNESNETRAGERRFSDTINKTTEILNPKKIFGLEIFNNGVLSFEPNINIATPVGYVIGPNDEININIFGYQEAQYNLKVGPEGNINIPYVGVMYIAGLTIEQATAKIKSRLSNSGYSNIRTGLTKVSVSIGRIRSIKITVLGEVKTPGSYTLSSLATAFNALYLSGGPNDIGSMRNIEIIRNGKVIDNLDIYDFLVKGNQQGNISLHDQDVIRIPAYKVRVSLEGEVKRTGLFEMKQGETLQELFNFAGGFSDSAYTAAITAYQVTDIEKRIVDVQQKDYSNYKPSRSETFVVKKIVGRFMNRVSIAGAVYLPGDFELNTGMTIKDLIIKAQGLKEDAFNGRGIIERNQENLFPEYISFNPAEVMQKPTSNILLRRDDKVLISSVSELQDNTTVSVMGEVRNKGVYPFVKNMSLKDLILLAGGFTDAAVPQRIEVARRIKKDTFNIAEEQISEVYDINSVNDLEIEGGDIKLRGYDVIIVRKNPGYRSQVNVSVEGEVFFPGAYVLKTKNERVSNVIKRAGGLTPQAFDKGVYITRVNNKTGANELNSQKINKIQETLNDTANVIVQAMERKVDQIAINLGAILDRPGGQDDLILEEGDVITIPKEKMDVRISGQVLFPTRVIFDEQLNLKDYLGRAGGVAENARKGKIYVLYPNGNAAKTGHFLFFRRYPKVAAGSEVIVPKKHEVERRRLSTGEVIGITTAITSFAGVLLSVLINSK